MLGARSCAVMGFEPGWGGGTANVSPDLVVRALLADLVPFEDLDNVMNGIAASADSTVGILVRVFTAHGLEVPPDEVLQQIAASTFFAVGQEITYALLLAGADGRS
jgi:hypothetical protein